MPTIYFDKLRSVELGSEEECLSLIEENTKDVINQLNKYIETCTVEQLKNSTTIYWLAHLLRFTVKNKNRSVLLEVAEMLFFIAQKEPNTLVEMLSQTIPSGKKKNLSIFYLLFNDFYLATFDVRNYEYILQMMKLIQYLLQHSKMEALACVFIQAMPEGSSEEGKSALFVLAQAVLQATKSPFNTKSTLLITQFFTSIVLSLGSQANSYMTQRLEIGPFSGKSIVYELACALNEAARTNIEEIFLLCALFKQLNATHHESLVHELSTRITEGPNKGLSPLHIILIALISVAYIDNNEVVVNQITHVIQEIVQQDTLQSIKPIFHQPISEGLNCGKTGHDLLKIALEKAALSHIPTHELHSLVANLASSPLQEQEVPRK